MVWWQYHSHPIASCMWYGDRTIIPSALILNDNSAAIFELIYAKYTKCQVDYVAHKFRGRRPFDPLFL
jgi:hypothetical protein